jgi:hypothetical protein
MPPFQHALHRALDLLQGRILVDKPGHAERQQLRGQLGLRVGGEHHDPGLHLAPPQFRDDVPPVDAPQVQVDNQQVRRLFQAMGQCFATVGESPTAPSAENAGAARPAPGPGRWSYRPPARTGGKRRGGETAGIDSSYQTENPGHGKALAFGMA